jgi:hypothetical protein
MIEKNIDNTEIPVKLMGTLRRGSMHLKNWLRVPLKKLKPTFSFAAPA